MSILRSCFSRFCSGSRIWFGILGLFISTGLLAQEMRTGTYPDGGVRYKGRFLAGKPVGELLRFYPDGKLQARLNHRGDSVDAVLYSRDGECTSAGLYLDRKKSGTWEYRKGERLLTTEDYREDRLEGWTMRYFASGTLAERKHWKAGKPDGPWVVYYENGKPRLQGNFSRGKLEGPFRAYGYEGKIRTTGNYREDLKEGEWKYYDEQSGNPRSILYRAGIPENADQLIEAESRRLDRLVEEGKKIPDPAVFQDEPEVYMKVSGIE